MRVGNGEGCILLHGFVEGNDSGLKVVREEPDNGGVGVIVEVK